MRDYNHDGRTDARDAAVFHNVIMDESGSSSPGGYASGGGLESTWSTVVILVVMMIFRPGKLFSGIFPTLVWLVCLGLLFLKFGAWLEDKTR